MNLIKFSEIALLQNCDLPPANSAIRSLVKFVFGEDEHEEALYGTANHRVLKEAEAGMPVKELCRKHGFNDASFYTWRAKFAGMESRGRTRG
ncbi:transposase family protein [Paraburkholderia xenovorans LB400]|nr:transposase family protein [Paraburkholderia xenovorans LB400]